MKYKISFGGRTYEVEVEVCEAMPLSEYIAYAPAAPAPSAAPAEAAAPAAAPAPAPVAAGSGEPVNAPMPGTILRVNVQNGQAVKEGDVLCVLEAMKMENEIPAPRAGTVCQVLVTKGATVDTGSTLLTLS